MTLFPLWFIISVSLLLYKSSMPVQGRVVDEKKPSAKINETMADAALVETCGFKFSKRIIGGQHASPGEWRWHVQLAIGSWHVCGGSLLTPQWVITAAHCVGKFHPGQIRLILGEHTRSRSSGKEQQRSISKIIMHPQYHFPEYDFALLKLTSSAAINEHVGTICLPESTEKLPVGTVLWETGWGSTTSYGSPSSDVLKDLEVIVVPPDNNPWRISNSEFITTATQRGHGHCSGDSGGPVVTERDGRWYLEGVVSWVSSDGCASPGNYDGQADVRAALQWIKDTIKNN